MSKKNNLLYIVWPTVFVLFFLVFFKLLDIVLALLPEPIGSRSELFYQGAFITLQITLISGVLGLIIGLFIGLCEVSKNKIIAYPAFAFVWIMRGTPLLVQILFAYYALPVLLPFLSFNEFTAAAIALGLNTGAYNAEVIRAGIIAIPKGQIEAAQSIGLRSFFIYRLVILPQAFRIVTPPLVNNLIALLKDSSLASSISLLELTLAGQRVSSETFQPVPVLTTVAFVYLALTTSLTLFTGILERKLKLESVKND